MRQHERADEGANQSRQTQESDRDQKCASAEPCDVRGIRTSDADDDERHDERNYRHANGVHEERAKRLDDGNGAFDGRRGCATQKQTKNESSGQREKNARAER